MIAAVPAQAAPIVFEGSGSAGKSARVTFENVNGSLVVRLKNTSMSDVMVPSDLLTAVFFNVNGNPALTRTSAVLGNTSTVVNDTQPAGGVVGGEWAYRNGLNTYGANTGLSSTGLNLFGAGERFPGPNLDGPNAPDGMQYGITSAGDNPATANGGLAGTPLIKNGVVFTLGGWGLREPTDYISNVTFHYGTSFGEGSFTGKRITLTQVPEPTALLLFGVAGIALRLRSRRKQH